MEEFCVNNEKEFVENLLNTYDKNNEYDAVVSQLTFDISEKINSALDRFLNPYVIHHSI